MIDPYDAVHREDIEMQEKDVEGRCTVCTGNCVSEVVVDELYEDESPTKYGLTGPGEGEQELLPRLRVIRTLLDAAIEDLENAGK